MFTGLVQELGKVQWLRRTARKTQLSIQCSTILHGLRKGDSVAVNGCCLSAAELPRGGATFDLLEETLERTNLHRLRPESTVNLELPLKAEERLGGHFVQGHVDGTTEVQAVAEVGNDLRVDFVLPPDGARYVAFKGSIAINGTSLTVAALESGFFTVWLIPITRSETNLGHLQRGDLVNLEYDILAKYVERFLAGRDPGGTPTS